MHDDGGTVEHAELAYGDGTVMIGSADDAGGAEIIRELEDQDYG